MRLFLKNHKGCLNFALVSRAVAISIDYCLLISLRMLCCGIWAHCSSSACWSSGTFVGRTERSDIAVCSMSQVCSIELRSVELTGQFIPSIVAVYRYLTVTCALCRHALSSIKMKSGSIAPSCGGTYTSKIYLMYRAVFGVLLWTIYRSVFPCMLIPAYTMTELPPKQSCLVGQ